MFAPISIRFGDSRPEPRPTGATEVSVKQQPVAPDPFDPTYWSASAATEPITRTRFDIYDMDRK